MAEIWLAHQEGPAGFAKQIVIKKILPHLSDDQKFVEMFLDEARLAAQLSHPNIGQIFDLGEVEGQYFIAMEFIDGWDLERVIERASQLGRSIPPEICARIMADACTALDYAHSWVDPRGEHAGLVHRDVSPQNILVTRQGVVKLVDFGVAKARTSSHKTQTGAVKGKLSYMSPEQITAKELDGRSDIFALGIVLYEVLTTQRPFGHESELLAVTSILNDVQRRPQELNAEVPEALEAVIERALMKRREDRFPTAGEMQVALEHALHAMGRVLTSKDVGAYLADLFSDAPSDNWSARAPSGPRHRAQAGLDTTLPHHQASAETGVLGDRSAYAASNDEPASSGRSAAVLAVLLLLFLGIVGGGGFAVWKFFVEPTLAATAATDGPGSEGDAAPSEAVAAVTPTEATQTGTSTTPPGTPPDPTGETPPPTPDGPTANDAVAGTPTDDPGAGGPDEPTTEEPGAGEAAVENAKPQEGPGDTGNAEAGQAPDGGEAAPPVVDPPATERPDERTPSEATGTATTPSDSGDAEGAAEEPNTQTPDSVAAVDVPTDREPASRDSGGYLGGGRDAGTRDRTAEQRATRPGTVQVVVTRGGRSTVFAGSQRLGEVSGSGRFDLPPGSHRIRVVPATGDEHTETVRVTSGATTRVTVR